MKKPLEKLLIGLREEELVTLNKTIIEKLKQMRKEKIRTYAQQFKVGDIVSFEGQGSKRSGVIIKINSRSLSIITLGNVRWNVDPSLLKHEINPSKQIQKLRDQLFTVDFKELKLF